MKLHLHEAVQQNQTNKTKPDNILKNMRAFKNEKSIMNFPSVLQCAK